MNRCFFAGHWFGLTGLLFSSLLGFAIRPTVGAGPAPDWIPAVPPGGKRAPLVSRNDTQTHLERQAAYVHFIREIVTSGLAQLLESYLTFYQKSTLLSFSGLNAVLFFQRRSRFPRLFGFFLAINATFLALDTLFSWQLTRWPGVPFDQNPTSDLLRAFLAAGVWIPCFLRSERVRETFTRTYQPKAANEDGDVSVEATNDTGASDPALLSSPLTDE